MAPDQPPIERVEFELENGGNSLSDTLSWVREQSSARRNNYIQRWTADDDVDVQESPQKQNAAHARTTETPETERATATDNIQANKKSVFESYIDPSRGQGNSGNKASKQGMTFGELLRRTSLYARTTATDASIYSRASYSESSLDSTPSTADRLQRAGFLLQGLSCAELDLPVDADAVDRLRAKLNRLSKDRSGSKAAQARSTRQDFMQRCSRPSPSSSLSLSSTTPSLLLHGHSSRNGASDLIDSYVRAKNTTHVPSASSEPSKHNNNNSVRLHHTPPNGGGGGGGGGGDSGSKKRTLMTVCVFDPDKMQGSQRAAIKAVKRAKDEAAAEAEARRRRVFKARPLPCGGIVKHDIFAHTNATMRRQSGPCESSSRPGTSQSTGSFISLPSSLSHCRPRPRGDNASACSLQPRMIPKKRNTARRRKLLADIDSRIRNEMNGAIVPYVADLIDDDNMSVGSDGADMSTLQQQIGRLEAQLKQKRAVCERTLDKIEALDDLDDLDALPASAGAGKKIGDSNDAARTVGGGMSSSTTSICPPDGPVSPTNRIVPARRDTFYHLQEKWVSMLEKKLEDARLEKADRVMRSITGKPRIASTGESWQKAKAAHDAAARRARKDYEQKMKEQEAREARISVQKMREMKDIEQQSAKQKQELLSKQTNIAKKRQVDCTERLSRPRCVVPAATSKAVQGEEEENVEVGEHGDKDEFARPTSSPLHGPPEDATYKAADEACTTLEAREEDNNSLTEAHDKSFADMDDKEFAIVMRRLGIKSVPKAKLEKKKKGSGNSKPRLEKGWRPSDPMGKLPIEAYSGVEIHRTKEPVAGTAQVKAANPGIQLRAEPKGRFVSSEAQASLLKKMSALNLDNTRPTKPMGMGTGTGTNTKAAIEITSDTNAHVVEDETSSEVDLEPYEQFETGHVPFFDKCSSEERGRFRVRDASSFIPDSMRRMAGPNNDTDDGIMFLVGTKNGPEGGRECAITILFDRKKYNEEDAVGWWKAQRHRFID